MTAFAASAVIAGWLALLAIDLDWTPVALAMPLHDLTVGVLAASTIAVLLGELHRRYGDRLCRHTQVAADATKPVEVAEVAPTYAQGVVDGMRLSSTRREEPAVVDLAPVADVVPFRRRTR
jgi:uncharacterized protein involved in response to NO